MNQQTLWLSKKAGQAFFRITGKGSFQNAGLLKIVSQNELEKGTRRFVFDMTECAGLDSTFLGTLAGLALKTRQLNGELVITRVEGRNRELIENMGLDKLVTLTEEPPSTTDIASAQPIYEEQVTKKETTKTMLEAHQTLVKIDKRNREQFQDVVERLDNSIKKQKTKP